MSKRFIRRGTARILIASAVANIHAVTRAEITAAVDVTDEVADISGWQLENQRAAVPDMGSSFEKSIAGTDQASDSTLTFYDPEDDDTIDLLLPKGTECFVIIMRKGDKPTSKSLGCYPSQVGSKSPEFNAGNEPARLMVNFSITEEPELDGVIPAATP